VREVKIWAAIASIVVGSWAINLTLSLGAIHYACQRQYADINLQHRDCCGLGWLLIQHYLAILLAGFVMERVTGRRMLR
jgi:hypothetical protein